MRKVGKPRLHHHNNNGHMKSAEGHGSKWQSHGSRQSGHCYRLDTLGADGLHDRVQRQAELIPTGALDAWRGYATYSARGLALALEIVNVGTTSGVGSVHEAVDLIRWLTISSKTSPFREQRK
jgi:hypothetical protein